MSGPFHDRSPGHLAGVAGDRWSEHFGRSKLGSNVFVCRIEWLSGYLADLGYPGGFRSMIMGPSHHSAAFADGGWFSRSQSYGFGFGGLRGQWIVGFGALRHVCDLLGLVPPRRLKGETALPDTALLNAEVARQMVEDRVAMQERAELLLTHESAAAHIPDAVFAMMGIPRPRLGLDEADTAMLLDATASEFLDKVRLR